MFSNKSYSEFKAVLNPILEDCRVAEPTKEDFSNNKYYVQRGLMHGTSGTIYVYDRKKLDSHKTTFLKLAKLLPKLQGPTNDHAGIILTLDLFTNITENPLSTEEARSQLNLANHFINFLTLTNIAAPCNFKIKDSKALALIIDKKYRDFMEPKGQEPADD